MALMRAVWRRLSGGENRGVGSHERRVVGTVGEVGEAPNLEGGSVEMRNAVGREVFKEGSLT